MAVKFAEETAAAKTLDDVQVIEGLDAQEQYD
jgi:methylase of polypeptide subunit release factors